MNYYAISRSSYLIHHGIKGQKWGVRRFQDYNGRRIGTKAAVKREHDAAVKRMNEGYKTRGGTGDPYIDNYYKTYYGKYLVDHPIEKLSEIERYDSSASVSNLREQINFVDVEEDYEGREYNCPNCAAAFEMVERGYSVSARPKPDGSNVEDIESFFKGGLLKTCDGAESLYEKHGFQRAYDKMNEAEKERNAKLAQFKESLEKKYPTKEDLLKLKNNVVLLENLSKKEKAIKKPYEDARDACWKMRDKICTEVKEKTLSELKAQGDGSRGIMVVGWASRIDPSVRSHQYHAFNYKVENGEAKFYDAQSRHDSKRNGGVDHRFFDDADPRDIYYMRTDNLDLSENIAQAVYSNKRKGT